MTLNRWTSVLQAVTASVFLLGGAEAADDRPGCVHPPEGLMALEGPQIRVGNQLWAGPTARVVVKWVDGTTGGPVSQAVSQGREELDAHAARRAPLPDLEICGRSWEVQPLAFAVDSAPPEITWELVDLEEFPNRRRKARKPEGLSWSGGASWEPLKAGNEPVTIRTDRPQLLLHGGRFDLGDTEVTPGRDQMLRIRFQDNGAGVDHLTFRLRAGPGRDKVLDIETVDLVGNARKVEWEVGDADDFQVNRGKR